MDLRLFAHFLGAFTVGNTDGGLPVVTTTAAVLGVAAGAVVVAAAGGVPRGHRPTFMSRLPQAGTERAADPRTTSGAQP